MYSRLGIVLPEKARCLKRSEDGGRCSFPRSSFENSFCKKHERRAVEVVKPLVFRLRDEEVDDFIEEDDSDVEIDIHSTPAAVGVSSSTIDALNEEEADYPLNPDLDPLERHGMANKEQKKTQKRQRVDLQDDFNQTRKINDKFPLPTSSDQRQKACTSCGFGIWHIARGRKSSSWIHPTCHQCLKTQRPEGGITCNKGIKCHKCPMSLRNQEIQDAAISENNKCTPKTYCRVCLRRWYSNFTEEEVREACFFCRDICNCRGCLRRIVPITCKGEGFSHEAKAANLVKVLRDIRPMAMALSSDQAMELQWESSRDETAVILHTPQNEPFDSAISCSNCRMVLVDLYRECPICHLSLCIYCCADFRAGQLDSSLALQPDGTIFCPHAGMTGVPAESLTLRSSLPAGRLNSLCLQMDSILSSSLQTSASWPSALPPLCCTDCPAAVLALRSNLSCQLPPPDRPSIEARYNLRRAASRSTATESYDDDFIFCPAAEESDLLPGAEEEHALFLTHFQQHWRLGQPVVVRQVITRESSISWSPKVLHRTVRDTGKSVGDSAESTPLVPVKYLDGSESKMSFARFVEGFEGAPSPEGPPPLLRLSLFSKPSSFKELLPRHLAEFINCLPLHEYTHPLRGSLNLAAMLPNCPAKSSLAPSLTITYGCPEELPFGNAVTNLHCNAADVVSLLTYCHYDDNDGSAEGQCGGVGGAVWDVFRREDVPKLEEYLTRCMTESPAGKTVASCDITSLLQDHHIFLSKEHKDCLREECGVEAWSFHQSWGEAVLVPAGCPYQVRFTRSSVSVVSHFMSSDNVEHTFQRMHSCRKLPPPKGKGSQFEVLNALLAALEHSVEEWEIISPFLKIF